MNDPIRTNSGNLASALDNMGGGLDDDFLTGDDVTMAEIYSLSSKYYHGDG